MGQKLEKQEYRDIKNLLGQHTTKETAQIAGRGLKIVEDVKRSSSYADFKSMREKRVQYEHIRRTNQKKPVRISRRNPLKRLLGI